MSHGSYSLLVNSSLICNGSASLPFLFPVLGFIRLPSPRRLRRSGTSVLAPEVWSLPGFCSDQQSQNGLLGLVRLRQHRRSGLL